MWEPNPHHLPLSRKLGEGAKSKQKILNNKNANQTRLWNLKGGHMESRTSFLTPDIARSIFSLRKRKQGEGWAGEG